MLPLCLGVADAGLPSYWVCQRVCQGGCQLYGVAVSEKRGSAVAMQRTNAMHAVERKETEKKNNEMEHGEKGRRG